MKDEPGQGIAAYPLLTEEDTLQLTSCDDSSDKGSNNLGITRKVAMADSSNTTSFSDNETLNDSALRPSHRAIDVLHQSQVMDKHRRSSGQNFQLKQLSVADGALLSAPNVLTPRASSGRRSGSRQRLHSADCNNHSNYDSRLQQRNSFSMAAHVLKDLEQVRSSTDSEGLTKLCEKPEHLDDDDLQQQEVSRVDKEKIQWDTHDDISYNNSKVHNLPIQAPQEEEQVDIKAVASFGLWGKAAKSKRLPGAIIFSGCTADESKPSHKSHSSSAPSSSRVLPAPTTVRSVSEMVSQLHVTHPHLAALALLGIPKAMSLTRSTSPRIRRPGFSSLPDDVSLRRATLVPTNNQQVAVEVKAISTLKVSSPITQWKRGELLGEGTFGKVYKGLNIATGELFALKKIEIHSSPNADQVTQMQKLGEEIGLMNNLRHKHIVRYKGSHCSASHFYIFMEYVSSGSITSMLKQFDAFSEDLIRIFTRQIVQGVVYLHQMGVIHRDIKGTNVLVNEQGVSKLADFGCSKQIPQMLTTSLEESLHSIRGSIPWMAPEVVKQTRHGYKADIWSIGATVIEMATAKHPWPHCHNGLAAMYTIAMTTTPPPFPENLSSEAKSFLQRCFCIDPNERATAIELSEHIFLAEKR